MSRIKSDKVNFGSAIVVNFPSPQDGFDDEAADSREQSFEDDTRKIIESADAQAKTIINAANIRAQEITKTALDELEQAKLQAEQIINEAKQKALELEQAAASDIEALKLEASQQGAKEGYDSGYADGMANIEQEMKQKIQDMDDLVESSYQMKQKILDSSKREIVELVLLIARKICLNSVDAKAVGKVVAESVSLLNDKENIELVLSEKYAKMLNDLFNGSDSQEIDIDKLKNIKLTYNSKINDDTLIVQTPKERLDLSFSSQIDEIARKFFSTLNTGEN